ncbi:MAG: hypothetical protein JW734_04385 [Candidatus Omnitrophica bacterium]|nr:hypothetical protein [Candidatus Omnitrophota bacterium]
MRFFLAIIIIFTTQASCFAQQRLETEPEMVAFAWTPDGLAWSNNVELNISELSKLEGLVGNGLNKDVHVSVQDVDYFKEIDYIKGDVNVKLALFTEDGDSAESKAYSLSVKAESEFIRLPGVFSGPYARIQNASIEFEDGNIASVCVFDTYKGLIHVFYRGGFEEKGIYKARKEIELSSSRFNYRGDTEDLSSAYEAPYLRAYFKEEKEIMSEGKVFVRRWYEIDSEFTCGGRGEIIIDYYNNGIPRKLTVTPAFVVASGSRKEDHKGPDDKVKLASYEIEILPLTFTKDGIKYSPLKDFKTW